MTFLFVVKWDQRSKSKSPKNALNWVNFITKITGLLDRWFLRISFLDLMLATKYCPLAAFDGECSLFSHFKIQHKNISFLAPDKLAFKNYSSSFTNFTILLQLYYKLRYWTIKNYDKFITSYGKKLEITVKTCYKPRQLY